MPFRIGEVYRYSSQNRTQGVPPKVVDGLPNFFYETYGGEGKSTISFQKGVHNLAAVKLKDGSKRVPAIIISSSPHKAGTEITPWEDEFDPDRGRIRYYGDGKPEYESADKAPGNALLRKTFFAYSSPDESVRQNQGIPLIFVKRVERDGRKKGNLMFQGFGVIESIELITQYNPKLSTPYFSNYVYNMCVFSMADEGESFSWDWINARRDPNLSTAEADKLAPKAWKRWIKEGPSGLHKVRRNVSIGKVIADSEQRPAPGSKEESILKDIYSFYQDERHVFELLALRVTQEIFEESGIAFTPGWITKRSGDGGIDFVAKLDISSQMSALKVVVLGQAKCEKLDKPTTGVHIARTVARLKRGWFGVYVTTSYFSRPVQLEVMDDQYPIMLICGKKLAETVEKILFKKGITLDAFLNEVSTEYQSKNRRAEDILSC